MAPITLGQVKIILSIITVIVALISAVVEIRKNPDYWLNRFFALFFLFVALGFGGFTVYHLITTDASLTLAIMVTTNVLLNLSLACLLMTEFILQYSEVIAIKPKYLLIAFGLFLTSIVGYAIEYPTIEDMNLYNQGEVNTSTDPILLAYITLYRLAIVFYVLFKFVSLVKQAQAEKVKKQLKLFSIGMIFIILGITLFLVGNLIAGTGGIVLEIIGQVCLNIGMIEIARGFLVKN
ncbi:hypothetical protein DSAG12_00042 [Promethearchaeum syntrophicum]|uniref:Uncharacterized protein n=1 Tax=Promethearchaeum syntrophicum TaxID=2594042 RepID=A0A5B9D5L8_9ARCH|nr:hypothetical protein [Candidatus Prometheoarchaeum syntrophicum]QEE14231.1 hypothetical protein DSAG12_00042 [Candidatus Prometheoarchaeum syntrophicum]